MNERERLARDGLLHGASACSGKATAIATASSTYRGPLIPREVVEFLRQGSPALRVGVFAVASRCVAIGAGAEQRRCLPLSFRVDHDDLITPDRRPGGLSFAGHFFILSFC